MRVSNDITTQGKVLCKGSGLKVYFQLKLDRTVNGVKEYRTFTYEVGNLQQILAETNRQTSWNFVAGRRNPVGVNKGLRNSYGTITFTQMNQGMINAMLTDARKWSADKSHLISANMENFSFSDYTFNEENAALIGGAEEELNVKVYKNEVIMLDDLPPVDIIVIGAADQIEESTQKFDINETYVFKCLKTTFLSETFGISAAGPLHNVATKVLFLGGVEPWKKLTDDEVINFAE